MLFLINVISNQSYFNDDGLNEMGSVLSHRGPDGQGK